MTQKAKKTRPTPALPDNQHTLTLSGQTGRLDKVLSSLLADVSRARLQKLIGEGAVTVNGKTADDVAQTLRGSETITVIMPEAQDATPKPQRIKLDIVYEDAHLLVVNKAAGMVVHPAAGNLDGTLVNALLAHCGKSLSGIGGVKRPGIVHRLDKDTSGLMVVAKNDKAHQGLSEQFASESLQEEDSDDGLELPYEAFYDFENPATHEQKSAPTKQSATSKQKIKPKEKTLSRVYQAFIWGAPTTKTGTITGDIGRSPTNRKKMALVRHGKHAVTHFTVLETYAPAADEEGYGALIRKNKSMRKENKAPFAALVECVLETGRTHQIRVHMAHIGNSIIGDELYGNAKGCKQRGLSTLQKILGKDNAALTMLENFPRQALHAKMLSFIHPISKKALSFDAPMPKDMQALLKLLNKTKG